MTRLQDSGIQYPEDQWSQSSEDGDELDPDYNDNYYRQHSNSVWELPSSPFLMTVDLESLDQEQCELLKDALVLDELDELIVYVERLQGEIQYLSINDIRFESVDELPYSVRRFLDDIFFGDVENPVTTALGSRVNLWDALRGEPDTQQALYYAGIHDDQGQIEVTGLLAPVSSLDRLEANSSIKMGDTINTRVVDMQVKQHLEQKANRRQQKHRRSMVTLILVIAVSAAVALFVLR